eukprot:c26903_g1_i2 orf=521-1648(-)
MGTLDIHEVKKRASFFLREKLSSARLALTDVTRIELLTEEVTNSDPWGPETRTMAAISDSAFEVDEYHRIVRVLHRRLQTIGQRCWQQRYKTLLVLEYLLTHGPECFIQELSCDKRCIEQLSHFSLTDERGIDQGIRVRKKADRILQFLNVTKFWKEERSRAQKISSGIHGFGSDSFKIDNESESINTGEKSIKDRFSEDQLGFHCMGQDMALLTGDDRTDEREVNNCIENNSSLQHDRFRKILSSPGFFKCDFIGGDCNTELNQASKLQHAHNGGSEIQQHPYKSLSIPNYLREVNEGEWHPFSKCIVDEEVSNVPVSEQRTCRVINGLMGLSFKQETSVVSTQETLQQKQKQLEICSASSDDEWHPFESMEIS